MINDRRRSDSSEVDWVNNSSLARSCTKDTATPIGNPTMAAATTATAKTVSQPLQLSSGDAHAVNGSTRRRAVKPSGKVTLTSLTENNVS